MKFLRLLIYNGAFNPNELVGEVEFDVSGMTLRVKLPEPMCREFVELSKPLVEDFLDNIFKDRTNG